MVTLLCCDGPDWSAKCIWIGFALIPLIKCYTQTATSHSLSAYTTKSSSSSYYGGIKFLWYKSCLLSRLGAIKKDWVWQPGRSLYSWLDNLVKTGKTGKNCIKFIERRLLQSAAATSCSYFHTGDSKYTQNRRSSIKNENHWQHYLNLNTGDSQSTHNQKDSH